MAEIYFDCFNVHYFLFGLVVLDGFLASLASELAIAMPVEVGARVRFGTMNDDRGEEYLRYHPYEEDGVKYLVLSWQDVCWIDG